MSVTITGLVVAAISWILQRAGVTLVNTDLTAFVLTAGQVLGGLVAYIGRVRQGDITWYGARKA